MNLRTVLITLLSLALSPCVKSQQQACNEFLRFKIDQYYTNVKNKPDSLDKLSCELIAQKLKDKEIFIDFLEPFGSDASVFLVIIIKKSAAPVIIDIPVLSTPSKQPVSASSKLEEELGRGTITLAKANEEALSYYAYKNLLSYLEPYLGDNKTIFYSTTGVLNFVNFKQLKNRQEQFLFEKYEMIRLHTAASFLQKKERLYLPEDLNVLLVGNIDYNCPGTASSSKPVEYRTTWQKLPGSKKEISDISKVLTKNVRVETIDSCKAGEADFVAKVNNSRFDIIHLATHGFYFKGANPLFGLRDDSYMLERSGIVLSGANHPKTTTMPFDDKGMFTALDFINMDFKRTGLFVLSTCHSGEGGNIHSGPPVGLTLALLRNSVNAMIISNRAVPDNETSIFMTTLYRYINNNRNIDECFTNMLRELHSTYPGKDWSFFDLVH